MYKTNPFQNIKELISPGLIQFLLAFFLILLIIVDKLFPLPTPSEIIAQAKQLFDKYGYSIVILGAFIESLFMIGLYFPGSVVIVLSVIVSNFSSSSLFQAGAYSLVGFTIANCINYILGRFGYYKFLLFLGKQKTITQMENWMKKRSLVTFFFSGIHPNFLSLSVVCSGIIKDSFAKVILTSTLVLAFWITVWIIVTAPLFKEVSFDKPGQSLYFVCFFLAWGVFNISLHQYRTRVKQKKKNTKQN